MFGFDSEQKGFSTLVLISSLAGVAIIAFIGAYFLFKGPDSDQLVVIKAPTTPVRVAPEDPGGLKLNSIDSPVMDLLVDQANDDDNTEILVPPVSEPELPPIDVTDDNITQDNQVSETDVLTASSSLSTEDQKEEPKTDPVETQIDTAEDVGQETPVISTAETVVAKTEDNTSVKTTPSEETKKPEDEINSAIDQVTDNTAVKEQPEENPLPRPKTPKIVNTTDNDAPSFVVQFAAFKNETRAKNTAAVLATKHENRLGEVAIGYMKRDQYWRVVTEPMPRADATALCRMFRSVGQDCITKLMETVQ